MADKKYFWLKLKDDFFDEKYIKALRRLPQGDSLVIVYLKMQLKSLKTNGIIKYEKLLPDSISELAMFLDEPENVVKLAVNALINFGAVERWENETLYMTATQELIGSESESAERVRRHRALKNDIEKTKALQCNGDVTKCNTEIDIEKDIEIEKEKDIESKQEKKLKKESAAADIEEFFERVWKLYPKKTNKTQIRKATKERLYKIGYEKIARCIERYKQELEYNHTEYQFIKAGSTFFNGGYEDYLADDWRLPPKRAMGQRHDYMPNRTPEEQAALEAKLAEYKFD